jgi:hypothetical protein
LGGEKKTSVPMKMVEALAPKNYSPADELMWLNFEIRMRNVVKDLLQPVVEVSE